MADNLKLLLVDDNPMVLGMLQHALSPLAKVTTATDAADALLKAKETSLSGFRRRMRLMTTSKNHSS